MSSKYEDSGIASVNNRRDNEKAPHYRGVLNFSKATLSRLVREYQQDGEAKIQFGVWRNDDGRLGIKISPPYEGAPRREREDRRTRYDPEDRPERSRGRDEREADRHPPRRTASDDDYDRSDRRESRRDERDDDPWNDEIPF